MLSLLYNYDENGVLRKRKKDINNTTINLDDGVFFSDNNFSIFWNVSKNESLDDFSDFQELLAGNHFKLDI